MKCRLQCISAFHWLYSSPRRIFLQSHWSDQGSGWWPFLLWWSWSPSCLLLLLLVFLCGTRPSYSLIGSLFVVFEISWRKKTESPVETPPESGPPWQKKSLLPMFLQTQYKTFKHRYLKLKSEPCFTKGLSHKFKGTVLRKLTGWKVVSIIRSSFRIESLVFFLYIERELALWSAKSRFQRLKPKCVAYPFQWGACCKEW